MQLLTASIRSLNGNEVSELAAQEYGEGVNKCTRCEVSDGAKRRTVPVVLTMRRLNNGDDGRLGRRGYCVGVRRGGAPGMTTVVFDGSGGKKSLWL